MPRAGRQPSTVSVQGPVPRSRQGATTAPSPATTVTPATGHASRIRVSSGPCSDGKLVPAVTLRGKLADDFTFTLKR